MNIAAVLSSGNEAIEFGLYDVRVRTRIEIGNNDVEPLIEFGLEPDHQSFVYPFQVHNAHPENKVLGWQTYKQA